MNFANFVLRCTDDSNEISLRQKKTNTVLTWSSIFPLDFAISFYFTEVLVGTKFADEISQSTTKRELEPQQKIPVAMETDGPKWHLSNLLLFA